MKKLRWTHSVFSILLLLCMVLLPSPLAQASVSTSGGSIQESEFLLSEIRKDNNFLVDFAEYEQIRQAIGDFASMATDLAADIENSGSQIMEHAYKVYSLKEPQLLDELQSSRSISELISEEYVWIVPIGTANKIRVVNDHGQWRVSGYSTSAGSAKKNNTHVNADAINAALGTLSKSEQMQLDNASESGVSVQCFYSAVYRTTFVLVANEGVEYLIPFGSASDMTGLENGTLYARKEVTDILNESFGTTADVNTSGGAGHLSRNTMASAPVIFLTVFAVLCMLAYGTGRLINRKKSL